MEIVLPGPILDSYWVVPGKLMAGIHPGVSYIEQPAQLLGKLLAAGVTTFVDLTEPHAHDPYEKQATRLAERLGKPITYYRFPILDMGVPEPAQMRTILDTLDQAIEAGSTVYVHCLAGLGRTGTVVGCYLVRHGLSGPAALKEINRLRQATFSKDLESPIRQSQIEMVRRWPVGG